MIGEAHAGGALLLHQEAVSSFNLESGGRTRDGRAGLQTTQQCHAQCTFFFLDKMSKGDLWGHFWVKTFQLLTPQAEEEEEEEKGVLDLTGHRK